MAHPVPSINVVAIVSFASCRISSTRGNGRDAPAFVQTIRLLAGYPRLVAGCTGRWGGLSKAPFDDLNLGFHVGDDPAAVLENRRTVARSLGVSLDSFVVPRQVHRGGVYVATSADRGRGAFSHEDAIPDTDALITRELGVVLAVMLADCVPVVLFDPVTSTIGVAHAGWGGTVHHVTRNTIQAMVSHFGTDPGSVLAGIGPSIGPQSYEVGSDVADRASSEFPGRPVLRPAADGRWLFDLWESNIADLEEAGVSLDRIEVAGVDTFTSVDQFFSDRRQRPTGRFMAVAALT